MKIGMNVAENGKAAELERCRSVCTHKRCEKLDCMRVQGNILVHTCHVSMYPGPSDE